MGNRVEVRIPYKPREQFKPFHARVQRWAFLLAHRRAGKTVATVNDEIRKLWNAPDSHRFYMAPFHVQAKDIAWLYVKKYTAPLLRFGGRVNESELSVTLPNRSSIRLYGAENGERLRGRGFHGGVLDEYADYPPHLLGEVILPTLAEHHGELTVIGTPKGRANDFYRLHQEASASPDWFYAVLRASETGILDAAELELQRSKMTADQFAQEYECSFDAAIKGAIYADELQKLTASGRITTVPHDPALPVHTWWDLGVGDATAIGFVQQCGAEVRAIDYYEASGEGLPHYAAVLQAKGYVYGKHWAPHDIQVRELGSGRSRIETAAALGIRFEIAPSVSLEDGIHATRMLLPRMWMDRTKCARWCDALANYRWAENKALGELRSTPVHDWASHPADMTRYGALSLQPVKDKKPPNHRAAHAFSGGGGWMR